MQPGALAAALALGLTGAAPAPAPPTVQVSAIPEFGSVQPGGSFRVALRLRIPDGYHISWVNPGRTGLPTTVAWRTPPGIGVGATEWPYPERDVSEGMVNHVYRGDAVVVTRFRADTTVRRRAVLRAELSWGLCGTGCRLQRDTVEIALPVRDRAPEAGSAWRAIGPSLEQLPLTHTDLTVRALARPEGVRLTVEGPQLGPAAGTATYFPRSGGLAVVVPLRREGGTIALTLPGGMSDGDPRRLEGLLVADSPWLVGSLRRALAVEAAVQPES